MAAEAFRLTSSLRRQRCPGTHWQARASSDVRRPLTLYALPLPVSESLESDRHRHGPGVSHGAAQVRRRAPAWRPRAPTASLSGGTPAGPLPLGRRSGLGRRPGAVPRVLSDAGPGTKARPGPGRPHDVRRSECAVEESQCMVRYVRSRGR
jgi:hypothetical protein